MCILDISIIIFILLETANVCILYFAPDSKYGNGVAVFNHWETSKNDQDMHLFVRYMTNWVAGTKLIFIVLLIILVFTASNTAKLYTLIVLILSIGTYYWRLHPIVKDLDAKGLITPKGYSKVLGYMIGGFITLFSINLTAYLISLL